MRIAQIVSGKNVDGASRHALDLSCMLASRGHDVHLMCRPDSWVFQQATSAHDVRVKAISFRRRKANWQEVAKLLHEEAIQLTHAHKTSACLFSALLRWKRKIPSVATAHHRSWQVHWYGHDQIIVPSGATGQYLRRRCWIPDSKLTLIPYPQMRDAVSSSEPATVTRQVLGIAPGQFVMSVIGTVEPRKNLLTLVRALGHLEEQRDRVEVLAVGLQDPAYTQRVATAAARLGCKDRLHLLGPRNDVPELLAASDAVCLPSLHEQLPLSILEAMAAGRVVIASPVGGLPDLIRHDVDGLLVPAKSPALWAEQLTRLMRDQDLRERLERAAQTRVRDFCDPTRRCDEIVQVYQSVLENSSTRDRKVASNPT